MDIESAKESEAQFDKITIITLIKLVSNSDFNPKKSLYWLNKLKDRERCYHQLESRYSQISIIEVKTNFLLLLTQLQAQLNTGQAQTEQRIKRMFLMICQVRWQIDSKGEEREETLMQLNKILKIANGLIDNLKLVSSSYTLSMEQCSFYEKNTRFMLEKEAEFPLKLMINHLFRIKLFLYILEASPVGPNFQSILKGQIINSLVFITNFTNEYGQIIEEIFLNTYISSSKSIRNFQQDLSVHFIQLIKKFSNKTKLQLIYETKSYIISDLSNIVCQTVLQYQYFSLIIQDYSPQLHPEGKEQLAGLWLQNLVNLLKNEILVDIVQNSSDFQKELAYSIYFKIDAYCKACENDASRQIDKKIGVYIWSSFILSNYMFDILQENKSIHLSSQVMFFKCLREIMQITPNTLPTNIQLKVLEAYSKYYGFILLQPECEKLNQQIIIYLIHNKPQLIRELMIKFKNIKAAFNKDYINMENYNQAYLEEMVKVLIQGNNLKIPFELLEKKVGKIFFKFIIGKNIISISELFSQLSVISYTIQNDIEIHNDKVEHSIQQSIYTNMNQYIGLLLKSHSKNRYRTYIDSCLINLLLNELQSSSNRKLITITQNIMIYFVRNSYSLFNYSQVMQVTNSTYIRALFSFISRSLYYNIPLLSYYLLITAITIKNSFQPNYIDTEIKLVFQLTKFNKMYQNHRQFSRIGITCLLITIHGLPMTVQYKRSQEIDLHAEQNNYFISLLVQFLSNQVKQTEKASPLRENLVQFNSFHNIMEKCFNVALNRHLLSIFQKSNQYVKQVILLFGFLQDLLDMEFNETKIKQVDNNLEEFIGKKRLALKKYHEKQVEKEDENQNNEIPAESGFMEKYLAYYYSFNEFEEYKSLEEILPLEDRRKLKKGMKMAECDRVHGKIRKIRHISK